MPPITDMVAKSQLKSALSALPGVVRVGVSGTCVDGKLAAEVWRKGATEPETVTVKRVEKTDPVTKEKYTEPDVEGAVKAYVAKGEAAKKAEKPGK